LFFAIGLQLRKEVTAPTLAEIEILQRVEGGRVNRAEIFYTTAKLLKDPVADIEDGGIATVQSLLLMTIFSLASSKRNSAWTQLGKSRASFADMPEFQPELFVPTKV